MVSEVGLSRRSVWLLALGAAAVGAGIAYLLDPVLGTARRRAARSLVGPKAERYADDAPTPTAPERENDPVPAKPAPGGRSEGIPDRVEHSPEHTVTSDSPSMLDYDLALRPVTRSMFVDAPEAERAATPSAWATRPDGHDEPLPRMLLPERRLSASLLVALAAGLAVSALALGSWAYVSKSGSSDSSPQAAGSAVERAIALLATPSAQQIALANSKGKMILVVAPDGNAILVLNDFSRAPAGKTYEAWVIPPTAGAVPRPAGTFSGSELVVPLTRIVRPGATVAVTIENAGGVDAPTNKPSLVAQRA